MYLSLSLHIQSPFWCAGLLGVVGGVKGAVLLVSAVLALLIAILAPNW
jgi:hypothetical protein